MQCSNLKWGSPVDCKSVVFAARVLEQNLASLNVTCGKFVLYLGNLVTQHFVGIC